MSMAVKVTMFLLHLLMLLLDLKMGHTVFKHSSGSRIIRHLRSIIRCQSPLLHQQHKRGHLDLLHPSPNLRHHLLDSL